MCILVSPIYSSLETPKVAALKTLADMPHPPNSAIIGGCLNYFRSKNSGMSGMTKTIRDLHQELGPIFKFKFYHGGETLIS